LKEDKISRSAGEIKKCKVDILNPHVKRENVKTSWLGGYELKPI